MPSLFSTDDFGGPRAAHGADASRQVSASSSFAPQGIRQSEYAALARQCDDNIETLKSLRSTLLRCAGTSSSNDDSTEVGRVNALLKKSRASLAKAEMAAEDEEQPKGDQAAIDRATKLLASVKRILIACVEDPDEETDEESLEKCQSAYKKASARLSALTKAKPATTATAKADAAPTTGAVLSQKAVQDLNKQTDVLQAQLSDVVNMIGSLSRNAGAPPVGLVKAANTNANGIPSNGDIEGAIQSGLLERTHGGDAKMIRNIWLQGDLAAARSRRDRSKSAGIHSIFANI